MARRLAVLSDVLLVFFSSIERSSSPQKLVSEFWLTLAMVLEDKLNAIR